MYIFYILHLYTSCNKFICQVLQYYLVHISRQAYTLHSNNNNIDNNIYMLCIVYIYSIQFLHLYIQHINFYLCTYMIYKSNYYK